MYLELTENNDQPTVKNIVKVIATSIEEMMLSCWDKYL